MRVEMASCCWPASLSKRAPSTTRTSLRFRINDLRPVPPQRLADCDKSSKSDMSRSLLQYSRANSPVVHELHRCRGKRYETRRPHAAHMMDDGMKNGSSS